MAGINKPVSKLAAVKKALKTLGKDAMPGKIQEFVKSQYGHEMTTAHVSNYKSMILRKQKNKKVTAGPATAGPVTVAARSSATGGLNLQDIETVKGLLGRVGEENLKSLVGLLK